MLKLMHSGRGPLTVLALHLALGACSGGNEGTDGQQTIEGCKAQYAPEKGYGFASEPPICSSPPPPAPMPECPPSTPQSIAVQCSAAGAPCDANQFITRDAAMCIARAQGLAEGLSPWTTTLVFRVDSKRPFWMIQNVTKEDVANCSRNGNVVPIDAITGFASPILAWGATC
jgi:hypothetical protein